MVFLTAVTHMLMVALSSFFLKLEFGNREQFQAKFNHKAATVEIFQISHCFDF